MAKFNALYAREKSRRSEEHIKTVSKRQGFGRWYLPSNSSQVFQSPVG
jgi:hypothetical protein